MTYLDEWTDGPFAYRVHPNGEVERGGFAGSVAAWSVPPCILWPREAYDALAARNRAKVELSDGLARDSALLDALAEAWTNGILDGFDVEGNDEDGADYRIRYDDPEGAWLFSGSTPREALEALARHLDGKNGTP